MSLPDSHICLTNAHMSSPGRFMVRESVWLTVASVLVCFKITKPVDEHGNVIEPVREYISGILR